MNGFSVLGEKADQHLHREILENLNLKSKTTNCNFYPSPSDTMKHSLESCKPGSTRLTLNIFIV